MRVSGFTSVSRFISVAAIPLAVMLSSGAACAQYGSQRYPSPRDDNSQRELFEWSGRVDREIRIEVGRRNASIINIGSNERNNGGRVRTFTGLPRRDGNVTVQVLEGRGRVDVVQQPSARNGYTAIVRLRDPDGGSARYRIAAYFTTYNNGRYGRRG